MNELSKQILNEYFDASKTGFWKREIEDGTKARLYADQNMIELLGAPEDLTAEECNDFFMEHIYPEDKYLLDEYDKELMKGNAEVVYRYNHPVNGLIYVRCGGRMTKAVGNQVTFVGYHKEMSDTIHLEDGNKTEKNLLRRSRDIQILRSQTFYREIMDNIACGIVEYTLKDNVVQYANAEMLKIVGVKDINELKENVWKFIYSIVYSDNSVIIKLKNLLKEDGDVDYEGIVTGIDGKIRNILVHVEAVTTPQGERSVFSTFLDITENRALKSDKHIFDTLSKDYLTFSYIDFNKKKIIALKKNSKMPEIDRQEFTEADFEIYDVNFKKYYDEYVDKESAPDYIDKLSLNALEKELESNPIYTYRFNTSEKFGKHYFEVFVSKVDGIDGAAVMGYRLIDDVVKAESQKKEELEAAFKKAKVASVAKTQFLNNMSHDIRTPMNAILGYNQIMKKKLTDPVLLDYQDKIEQSGNLLLSIINNVLDMARIESGKLELDENYVKATDLVDDMYYAMVKEAEKKNIEFTCSVDITNEHIMCDVTKIKEIYLNLLSNAIKYTPSGKTVSLSFKELPCEREGHVIIQTEIVDTGIGMSREFLPHIFDSFEREKNTTIGKVHGTGLGMSIVKRLVDLMGGTIDVESELGKGSKFTVTLEHKIADKTYYVEAKNTTSKEMIEEKLKGKHILLAEDNDLNAEIATIVFTDAGLIVDRAEDGIQCVAKMENHPAKTYDLILMDIQMPNMDGYKATQVIRHLKDKAKAGIPIVAMTANAFEEDKKKAFEVGINEHIAKPIDIKRVEEVLVSILK